MRFLPFMVLLALALPASAETLELSLTQKNAIRLIDSNPGFCAASSFFLPGTRQLGDIPRAAFSLACLGGALLLPSPLPAQTQTNALVVGYLLAGGWNAYDAYRSGLGLRALENLPSP